MTRHLTTTAICLSLIVSFIALGLMPNTSHAAGRTYSPSSEVDPRSLVEVCRFKRLDRTEKGNNCIYQRQSGGKDKLLPVDFSTKCQAQFMCKKLE